MADPRFPWGGVVNPGGWGGAPTHNFAKISQKLHEGPPGAVPRAPLRSAHLLQLEIDLLVWDTQSNEENDQKWSTYRLYSSFPYFRVTIFYITKYTADLRIDCIPKFNSTETVADLRGVPLTSCSFSENLVKSYVGAPPPRRVDTRLLRGILDPPLRRSQNTWPATVK